jgi:hypothetical protein
MHKRNSSSEIKNMRAISMSLAGTKGKAKSMERDRGTNSENVLTGERMAK